MKHLYLIAALSLPFSSQAMAQSVEALAEKYVELPDVVQMMDEMFSPESMMTNFEAGLPAGVNLPAAKKKQIGVVMSESMMEVRPSLVQLMVDGMAKSFSAEEVQALIDFYSSEHGGAVMRKMQPYMAEVMGDFGPILEGMQRSMLPKIIRIVQE